MLQPQVDDHRVNVDKNRARSYLGAPVVVPVPVPVVVPVRRSSRRSARPVRLILAPLVPSCTPLLTPRHASGLCLGIRSSQCRGGRCHCESSRFSEKRKGASTRDSFCFDDFALAKGSSEVVYARSDATSRCPRLFRSRTCSRSATALGRDAYTAIYARRTNGSGDASSGRPLPASRTFRSRAAPASRA